MASLGLSTFAMSGENWTLDALGNWSSQTVDGTATSRTHNSLNQLTLIGGVTTLTYDNNGNMLTDDQGITYTYDAWNRQMTATPSGSSLTVYYAYDGLGRRISSQSAATNGVGAVPVALQINDGTQQGSIVRSVTLEFQSAVSLTTSNLTMNKTNGGTTAMAYALTSSNGGKYWTLTFSHTVDPTNYANDSLPDNGAYSLNVTVGSINQTFTFFCFYGDFDGNGIVNGIDFGLFAPLFNQSTNSSDWFMDADNNGIINGIDLGDFSGRFNQGAPGSYSGPILWNAQPPKDYYYSSNWQVLEDDSTPFTGGTTYVANQYVWGLAYVDEMILRDTIFNGGGNYGISGSGLDQRLYVTQDANWNTTGLVAPGGTMEQNFIYDPYGNAQAVNAAATTLVDDAYDWVYLHQGGRQDPVTGQYIFRHRDYVPPLGRWGEEDPIVYRDGLSVYQYLRSSPVNQRDPRGLSAAGERRAACKQAYAQCMSQTYTEPGGMQNTGAVVQCQQNLQNCLYPHTPPPHEPWSGKCHLDIICVRWGIGSSTTICVNHGNCPNVPDWEIDYWPGGVPGPGGDGDPPTFVTGFTCDEWQQVKNRPHQSSPSGSGTLPGPISGPWAGGGTSGGVGVPMGAITE